MLLQVMGVDFKQVVEMVERFGGQLSVRERAEGPRVLTLQLPRGVVPEGTLEAAHGVTVPMLRTPALSGRLEPGLVRGLLVDDSPVIRSFVGNQLQALGFAKVSAFSSGEGCLAHLAEDSLYQYALIDLHMPGMDGIALARAIRRRDSRMALIALTGDETASLRPEIQGLFAVVLLKPFAPARLLEAISQAVLQPARPRLEPLA